MKSSSISLPVQHSDSGANILAYLASSLVRKYKCLLWVSPVIKVTKLFFYITAFWANELECLSLASLSSFVQYLQVRPAAYRRGELLWSTQVDPDFTSHVWLGCKGLPGTNAPAYFASSSVTQNISLINIVSMVPHCKMSFVTISLQTYWTSTFQY